jgi:DNA-binding NarL/FixJ family response regulator
VQLFVVDDKELTRSGISMLLESEQGIDIVGSAVNGKEFFEKIEGMELDLVLMDIEMPVLNGIEATKRLKLERPSVKVIMLTDYDEDPLIKQAKHVGADGYLLKNVSRERLLQSIQKVMSGEMAFQTEEESGAANKPKLPIPDISGREQEVVQLLARGLNSQEIAKELFISKNTVDTHRKNLLSKTGSKNVAELIGWAARQGML